MAGEHPDDRTDFPPPMGKNPDLNASSVHLIEKRDLVKEFVKTRIMNVSYTAQSFGSQTFIILATIFFVRMELTYPMAYIILVAGTGQWATRASVIEMCDKVSKIICK
jgi:hypothetical protein